MTTLARSLQPSASGPGVSYDRHQTAMHIQACALQLGSLGGLQHARAWCREQGWGSHHTETVLKGASQLLVAENSETVEQTRKRLIVMLERELSDAAGCVVAYTKTGEPIVGKDRSAIAAYTRLMVTLTGLDIKTVHHVDAKDRPLRELTTEQLLAEEQRLAQELADRASPVEVLQVSDPVLTADANTIPSAEKTLAPAWIADAVHAGEALRSRAGSYGAIP